MLKTKLKPILKWAGGKSRIADKLNTLYDPHRDRRLVEPFCGGLGVALSLMPNRALLNDINPDLVNFYQCVQRQGFYLGIDSENSEENYYRVREMFNYRASSDWMMAQQFYYLNLAGYNGLCRYNQKGGFNVPYGKRKNLAICDDFRPYEQAFADWRFYSGDYKALVVRQDDFLIVDPPYDSADDKGFTSYSGNTFNWQEQIDLTNWLDRQPQIPQIACNAATDRIVQLYTDRGWTIEIVDMHTSISCNGDRTPRKEMFAKRYL